MPPQVLGDGATGPEQCRGTTGEFESSIGAGG